MGGAWEKMGHGAVGGDGGGIGIDSGQGCRVEERVALSPSWVACSSGPGRGQARVQGTM